MVSTQALKHAVVSAVDTLDADAGCISRMIGDVLLQIVEHVPAGGTLMTGHGYLVSDYPMTHEVLSTPCTRVVSLADDEPDEAEARLLRELGYDSLLMLPVLVDGKVWGLLEVYGTGRRFGEEDVRAAGNALAAALTEGVPRAAPPPDAG